MSLYSREELVAFALNVPPSELVFVRDILEASEGIGLLLAAPGERAFVLSPVSQREAARRLLGDLADEIELTSSEVFPPEELARVAD